MAVSGVSNNTSTDTSTLSGANAAGGADRFLKLLVAQMQNQDPLNPMDNAQVTSQMAQINTVTGIEKLNTTIEGHQTEPSIAWLGSDDGVPAFVISWPDDRRLDPDTSETGIRARVVYPEP